MLATEVLIVGGGPVGLALAIELGILGIKTSIYEKHKDPLQYPRAQLLNPRSMEFMRRWDISQRLIRKKLLPQDYPLNNIWCAGLNGKIYSIVNISENVDEQISPENYQRIPLWITEAVLRERLSDFSNVQFCTNHEITAIQQNNSFITAMINNRNTNEEFSISAQYLVACDGARSSVRKFSGISMEEELSPQPILNVVFNSKHLKEKMTVPKGILYYNLTLTKPAAFGCIDYENGLWYAQIGFAENKLLDQINISSLLDEVAGFEFSKNILLANFWMREAQIATSYRKHRIFLAGDAAHILPPTGGHGLNTGFGDAVNLAWKLAAKIKGHSSDKVLDSYEEERRPVALRNINAAKRNAIEAGQMRQKFPPEKFPLEFAAENTKIAKQHTVSLGVALGYCYQNSSIISNPSEKYNLDNYSHYQPLAEPGFFAPHVKLKNGKILYDILKMKYNILSNVKIDRTFAKKFTKIEINFVEIFDENFKKIYPKNFYLLRPDWHIAWAGNELDKDLEGFYFARE